MSTLLPKPDLRDASPIGSEGIGTVERFQVRALNMLDGNAFRAVRLEALAEKDGKYFGASYEDEAKLTAAQWRQKCKETTDQCIFGLFDGNQLVGVMAASKWTGDPKGETALWGSVYLKPEYRGKKLAASLYEAREEWTKRNPQYKAAVFFIREDNARSTAIHEKQGAEHLYDEPKRWADGSTATARWFRKQLVA